MLYLFITPFVLTKDHFAREDDSITLEYLGISDGLHFSMSDNELLIDASEAVWSGLPDDLEFDVYAADSEGCHHDRYSFYENRTGFYLGDCRTWHFGEESNIGPELKDEMRNACAIMGVPVPDVSN